MADNTVKKKKVTEPPARPKGPSVGGIFDDSQIQEFIEAFNMIDQNRDGIIEKDDLQDMFVALGKEPSDDYLEAMLKDSRDENYTMLPGPVDFRRFLVLFGDKLYKTDPEKVIRNAFAYLDEDGTGTIHEDKFREYLTS